MLASLDSAVEPSRLHFHRKAEVLEVFAQLLCDAFGAVVVDDARAELEAGRRQPRRASQPYPAAPSSNLGKLRSRSNR